MAERDLLAARFEQNRSHLQAVAYRMLGSVSEADDAVQETWLRLSRSDVAAIENLGAWLTTVVARVCLDMLRSRSAKHETLLDDEVPVPMINSTTTADPEREAMLADSVGIALLVVLDRLEPAERLAFVLHDVFGTSFGEIAAIVGRSPAAARQLASRARRRVRGENAIPDPNRRQDRQVVDRFLSALHSGDFEGLLAVLDPRVVVRIDEAAAHPGAPREIRGAEAWAKGAIAFAQTSRATEIALVDGAVGLIWAPRGRLQRVLRLTIERGRIAQVEIIGEPSRLRQFRIAVAE
jgi:RNA polymerase sigma factor (sigma-70 family)